MSSTGNDLEKLLSRVALTTMTFFFQIAGEVTEKEFMAIKSGSGEIIRIFLNAIASTGYIEKGEETEVEVTGEKLVVTVNWKIVDEEGLRGLLATIERIIARGKQELSPGKRRWHREPR